MTRRITLAVVFAAAVQARMDAAGAPLVVHRVTDDFQANSLGQWASYPPAQDAGYDPSLTPTADFGARGDRSLMRIVRAAAAGPLRFGFIKRLNEISSGEVSLRFEYRLMPASLPADLEIGLAYASGTRAVRRVPASGSWSNATVQFEGRAGDRIEAVYVVANVANGETGIDYRLLIDNVQIEAHRPMRFRVAQPSAMEIDPWPDLIARATYRSGENIAVTAAAPIELSSVRCALRDENGRERARSQLKASGGSWRGDVRAPAAAGGTLVLELDGETAEGRAIHTRVRLLVVPAQTTHPRLYFGPDDREALRARSRANETAALWAHLEQMAKTSRESGPVADGGRIFSMLDSRFLLPTLPAYFDVLTRSSSRIAYNALVGFINADDAARAAAKRTMLEVARWQTWTPPWFEAHGQHTYYPAGTLAADVALGYDLLHDDLNPAERSLIRRALIERAIVPTWREYVLDNRVIANTSNWIAHTVGGSLIALAAIYGDDADPELPLYAASLLRKLEDHIAASYLGDGSYGEGISYQDFDLSTLTLAMTAVDRVFGVDYWTRTEVTKSLSYQIHVLAQPITETQDMGDSHPPSGYSLAGIVANSSDPTVRWYYSRFQHRSISDFLLFPGAGPQDAPKGIASRLFPVRGNAVFRTGWEADDAILLFRAGPDFNHNHADQGSFLLRAFGENLAVDAGYADYYKDPYYAAYFSQAAGHNVVLVDGDSASQSVADTRQFTALSAYPRITASITSEFYDSVASELESVYQGRLRRFTRRVIFVKPRYVLVRDQLEAAAAPATYDWLLHVNDKAGLSTRGSAAQYQGLKASLALRVLSPLDATMNIAAGHLPSATFNPAAPKVLPSEPGILDVRTGPAAAASFLIALAPARTIDGARSVADAMQKSEGDNCEAVSTPEETIAFRTGPAGTARCGASRADASVWMISAKGEMLRVAGEQARLVETGGRVLMTSDSPLNFAARWSAGGVDLWTNSPLPNRVRILAPWLGGAAEVAVPAGEHFEHITGSGR